MTLYDLTYQFTLISNMEDADPQVIADTLESLEGEIEDKLLNIGRLVRNMESESEIIKAEEKRLSDKRRTLEKKVEGLKEYVRQAMLQTGKKKVNDGVITWAIQLNPPKVVVEPEADIPLCWYTEKVIRDLDKNAIKQAIVGGATIPGCKLVQEQAIRLK